VSDEALRDVYARIMRKRDATGRVTAVSVEQMQAVLERRGSEEDRVRTLDAIMRDQETRADFEILRAAYEAAPKHPSRTALPYAFAAALVLFVGAQVWRQTRTPPPDALRGSGAAVAVVAPGPSAPAGVPLHFTWHRVADATAYAIQIVDADGGVAYSAVTTDTAVVLPDNVRLREDRAYRWWVEANRPTGGPVKSLVQPLRVVGR